LFLVLAIAVCLAESWQRAKIKDLESGREAFQAGTTPAQAGPRYVLRRTRSASTSGAPIDAGTPLTVLSVDAGRGAPGSARTTAAPRSPR